MGNLRAHYEQWWSKAIGRIRDGKVESDPVLSERVPHRRRGLTLIARPSPTVRQRVAAFLRELGQLEPEQYYYTASELHVTVLSLFTATIAPEPFLAQTTRYVDAVTAALKKVAPIRIHFKGVTASPGAVMLQGFPEDAAMNNLREALRSQLQSQGLGAGVDQRYRLFTAHMTAVRFRSPLSDGERFAAVLERARQRSFGSATVRSLSLVKNDWYLSRGATRVIRRYRLPGAD